MSPTKRLTRLPPEVEAALPAIRDEWMGYGLSTAPANRAEAGRGVRLAYETAGLPAPAFVVWLDSPMAGIYGELYLRTFLRAFAASGERTVGAQVGAQVWAQVGDQVYRAAYGQHDSNWLAFHSYFSAIGFASCDRLMGLFALSCTGWWWPFKDAVIFTERPTELVMENKKLKKIVYPGGFSIEK